MQKDSQVKFVRVRGRVVPIRLKKGSGSRGGKFHSKMSSRERGMRNNAEKVAKAGLITSTGLFAGAMASDTIRHQANKSSRKMLEKGFRGGKPSSFKMAKGLGKVAKLFSVKNTGRMLTGSAVSLVGTLGALSIMNKRPKELAAKRGAKIRALNKRYGR